MHPATQCVQPNYLQTIHAISEEMNDMNYMLQDLSFGISDLRDRIAVLLQYSRSVQQIY